MFRKLAQMKTEIIDKVVVLKLKNIEHVQEGDICIDVLGNKIPELFYATGKQLQELKKRNVSFWVVNNGKELVSYFERRIDVLEKNVWMNSVHGSLDWSEPD